MILDDWEDEPQEPERVRDQEIDHASSSVQALFDAEQSRVFYSTEIETRLERTHFHWITAKALLELSRAGRIQTERRVVQGKQVNFYAHKKYRYYRRELEQKILFLTDIFDPEFTHAVGTTAELMFDSALASKQFLIKAKNATKWQGKIWTESNHNLDRIVSRDGVDYGIEIKNTQNYINREELALKLRMCRALDLRPLFILRFAPKTYMHMIAKQGGFGLLFEEQIYPMGYKSLMAKVRRELGLKVQSPREIKDGDMQRLENWHLKKLSNY